MDDERALQRIRSLLAKAESTEFREEALALTAKAHELMAAHAVDQALLAIDTDPSDVQTSVVGIQAPYAKHKYLLLSAAARANDCQAILGIERTYFDKLADDPTLQGRRTDRLATIVGFGADIELTEMLFTSLLVQASNVVLKERPANGALKSYRRAFIVGFARAVNDRLLEVRDRIAHEAAETTPGVLPVLASRKEQVDAEVGERFPGLGSMSLTVSNPGGYNAGQRAGRQADLDKLRLGSARARLDARRSAPSR